MFVCDCHTLAERGEAGREDEDKSLLTERYLHLTGLKH